MQLLKFFALFSLLQTLEKISLYLTNYVVRKNYKEEYTEAENTVKVLEAKLKTATSELESHRLEVCFARVCATDTSKGKCFFLINFVLFLQYARFRENQRQKFIEHNFRAKVCFLF